MKNKTIILALIISLTCRLNLFGQVRESDSSNDNSKHPDTKSIDNLSNVEVWAGQIKKLHLDGINKRDVVSPIYISTAKLISPISELSPFSKACIDQLKPITGKTNYFIDTYLYYDEAEDFPNGQLPQVGETWIFTCRRGIDGGLHLLSGARLEASGNPNTKQPWTNTQEQEKASSLSAPEQFSTEIFLGLRDNESRKVGDFTPESAVADVTTISTVSVSDYTDYQKALQGGRIKAHDKRGGYIYYAIESRRDVPFQDGSSAWVDVTERYKAKIPVNPIKTVAEQEAPPNGG